MKNPVNRVSTTVGVTSVAALGTILLGMFAGPISAQSPEGAPAPAVATTADVSATKARPMLSLTDIEKLINAQGVRVSELEVKDSVVEVEGRDTSNREVKLLVDRRSGEILSRKLDD